MPGIEGRTLWQITYNYFAYELSPGWYSVKRSSNKNLYPNQGYVNEIFPMKLSLLTGIYQSLGEVLRSLSVYASL